MEPNPFDNDDKFDPLIPSGSLQIYQYIRDEFKGFDTNVLRASAASSCARQRWYKRKGYEAEVPAPRSQLVFMAGDIAEKVIAHFIKEACVGPGKLYSEVNFGEVDSKLELNKRTATTYKQLNWKFKINEHLVEGHPDGVGKRNSDGQWELIEIKSASNYGFDSFKEEGPGEYLKQAHANMLSDEAKALGIKSVRFWYFRKETSHVWDRLENFDQTIADHIIKEFIEVMGEEAPPDLYPLKPEMFGRGKAKEPTGRLTTGDWKCNYCPYLKHCKGPHEIVYSNGKPKKIFNKKGSI